MVLLVWKTLSFLEIWMITLLVRVGCKFFFSFHHFEYLMSLPSGYTVSAQISLDTGFSLYTASCFSLAALRFFSIFNFWHFNFNVSWCGPLWIHLICNSLGFLDLDVCFFPSGKFLAIKSSDKSSAPFSHSSFGTIALIGRSLVLTCLAQFLLNPMSVFFSSVKLCSLALRLVSYFIFCLS